MQKEQLKRKKQTELTHEKVRGKKEENLQWNKMGMAIVQTAFPNM